MAVPFLFKKMVKRYTAEEFAKLIANYDNG